ncbi:MAG TPA: pyruvate formate lyase family protein [Armatimonadota bacterium]
MPSINLWTLQSYIEDQYQADAAWRLLPAALREAAIFEATFARLPIALTPGESLAGDPDGTWDALCLPPGLHEEITRWAVSRPAQAAGPLTPAAQLAAQFHCSGGFTPAHTCIDYAAVVTSGITGILDAIAQETPGAHDEKAVMLQGMAHALRAVMCWAERYAELAEAQGQRTTAETCRRVPRYPARTFHEALQAIWFLHVAIGVSERSTASLSLGRLDQYLYPLFCADLARGIVHDELANSLADFFRKLNRYGDAACAVNLGGLDVQGRDLFNPLSEMIVAVAKRLKLPAPILAARVHPHIPQHVFDQLVDAELFAMGQPTFYGELSCREALVRRGVAADQIAQWAANSCMGLMMPGEEIADMWGSVVTLLLPLELALNGGQPFHHPLPMALAATPPANYANFDMLLDTVLAYTDELVAFCLERNRLETRAVCQEHPSLLVSALLHDCIARGKDRALGGARYHTVNVDAYGLVNVADALFAIKQFVFDERRYTLRELADAAKTNYAEAVELHGAVLRLPKFGNGDEAVDAMTAQLAARFAHLVQRYSTPERCCMPSFHTLNGHIGAGAKYGASLDGRLAGEPLAKNIGTMPERQRQGHTALILSAAAIPQREFFGGQALDLSFGGALAISGQTRQGIQALLQTYFQLGGLQIQVNSIAAATLRQAIDTPEQYQHLTVRIAGYSARFVTLAHDVQEEMAERFAVGV